MESFKKKPGTKAARENWGDVLVLGLGKSGQAVVDYLARFPHQVNSVTVAAGASTPEARVFIEEISTCIDFHVRFDCTEVEGSFDLCIASPGISENSMLYKSASQASTELIGEVELAWRESAQDSVWVAITGTNGKTTVTALVAHLLLGAGLRAKAVGNIGDTCLEAVSAGDTDVYVAEVSSYQLSSIEKFAPCVAVVLNITPDHLSWHGSFESYRNAKLNMLEKLSLVTGSIAVLDATNDTVREYIRTVRCLDDETRGYSYIPLGAKEGLCSDMRHACGSENAAFLSESNELVVAFEGVEIPLIKASELQIAGEHNISNALAASAAALALGVDASLIEEGLRTFSPLEHRIEPCGCIRGVACYNDSKATNVDATLKALESFPGKRVVVLLGGYDKGTDLSLLVDSVHKNACAAVCFGAAGGRFAEALLEEQERSLPAHEGSELTHQDVESFCVARAKNLKQALDAALSGIAQADVILLSPACASFDEFNSFEERGEVFKNLVAQASSNKAEI